MDWNHEQWTRLVRRSLGVPDVIGEAVAWEIAADVIYKGIREDRGKDLVFEAAVGEAIVEAVVQAGTRGELDSYLVARPGKFTNGPTDALQISESIVVRVRDADRRMQGLPQASAIPILANVQAYVQDHPFDPPG